jgi:predicted N-acyltransferase
MSNVAIRNLSAEVRYDWLARSYGTFNFFIEQFTSRNRKEILRQGKGNILEGLEAVPTIP